LLVASGDFSARKIPLIERGFEASLSEGKKGALSGNISVWLTWRGTNSR